MSVLTIVDVTGTQNYIFGTNKLRENIGASELVAQATDGWIRQLASKNEIIYCGGGNAFLLFETPARAKDFAKKYTKKLLQDAPNLDVVVKHSKTFDINSPNESIEVSTGEMDDFDQPIMRREIRPCIDRIVKETFQRLNEKKANRKLSAPLLGLAVTAQCVSTGGAANDFEEKSKKYVSAESLAKLKKTDAEGNKRLKDQIFDGIDLSGLEIPLDFDHLGRTKDETSFLAVVHTDGNGMGNRVKAVGKAAASNQDWIDKVRAFSESIKDVNKKVLQKTIEFLLDNLDENRANLVSANGKSFELIQNEHKTKRYLPFRPLIFGGDDLTFVCDARIALDMTAFYLKELARKKENGEFVYKLDDGKPLYARAGIAIVKSHYPFRRAYELAEKLAEGTKDLIKEIDRENKEVYAIDWHVAMSGLFGSVEEIRGREYTITQTDANGRLIKDSDGNPKRFKLNMRPLSVDQADQWRTWEVFEDIIKAFQGNDKNKSDEENDKFNWSEKRNKVKAFRDALRDGEKKVEEFLTLNNLIEKKEGNVTVSKMPKVPAVVESIETTGWSGITCGYFDAIEMLDLYFPLKEKGENAE